MRLHNFQYRFINSVIIRTNDLRFDIRNFRLLSTSHQSLCARRTLRVYGVFTSNTNKYTRNEKSNLRDLMENELTLIS